MTIHYGRRVLVFLGLKEKKDLELELRKLSKEELRELHESESFKIGSAATGVFINGMLTCVFPSNAVGTTVNLRQLCVAIRARRKIEKAARENHGADLSKGDGRSSRRRHYAAGALFKTSCSVLFLGQDDLFAASAEAGLNLHAPGGEVELAIREASDALCENSYVSNLQAVAGFPAQEVLNALGMEYNPTWEELQQAGSLTQGLQAGLGVGAAAEANIPVLFGEAVAVKAHREIIRGETDRSPAAQENNNSGDPRQVQRKGE